MVWTSVARGNPWAKRARAGRSRTTGITTKDWTDSGTTAVSLEHGAATDLGVDATGGGRTPGATVTLTIDAVHREVRIVRLVATGVAAMAAFDLESTEDLRIAVDEACVWLIEHGDGSALRLAFVTMEPGRLRVTGETGLGPHTPGDEDLTGLVAQILAASCAEHRFEVADGVARFTLLSTALDAGSPGAGSPGAGSGALGTPEPA